MAEAQAPVRDATWDIARGIGMALVIYGHFLEPMWPARPEVGKVIIDSAFQQWQVIYSFHMMLFFVVSGAVNRNLPKKAWRDVLRGSLRLLALAWVVHIIGVFTSIALGTNPDATHSVWNFAVALFDPILEGFCWSIGVVWFLTALCFVQLLAYFLLRHVPALVVVLGAMAATAVVIYLDAPNQYLFRTWFPGLTFFAVGYIVTQWPVRRLFWLCLPLFVAVIYLAPLNNGCAYTFKDACDRFASGPFGVRVFGGSYGFLPLFFLSSLLGSLCIIGLSAGIARFKASAVFAYMGKKSLELFIINGFVATFLPGYVARIPFTQLNPLIYLGIAIAVVGAHLVVLRLAGPALKRIDAAAVAISAFLVRVITREPPAVRSKPA